MKLLRVLVAAVLVGLLVVLDALGRRWWPTTDPLEARPALPGSVVRMVSYGLHPLIADILWVDAVQYLGKTLAHHSHEVVDGVLVERGLEGPDVAKAASGFHARVSRVMDVDPLFVRVPLLGALFLVDPHADPMLGLSLLASASRRNPTSWQLRLWHGFFTFALRGDREGALRELEAASQIPGRPDYVQGVRDLLAAETDSVLAKVFFAGAWGEARSELERRALQSRLEELEMSLGSPRQQGLGGTH